MSAKCKVGKRPPKNFVQDDWQGIEEQHPDSCQSTYNSSSENLESDNEVFKIEDVKSEKDREEGEEADYEGMRCLMGSQVLELNVQPTNEGDMVDTLEDLGNPIELIENGDKRLLGSQELEMDSQPIKRGNMTDRTKALAQDLKIGKFGVTWEEIKNAAGTLNIELIEKVIDVTNLVEDKGDRSIARRKTIDRELHNLNFNINYDKRKMEMGIGGDT